MRKGKKVINLAQESIEKNDPKPTIYDEEIKAYREVREKEKRKRIRNNMDLIRSFNETAAAFVPIYQKRLEHQFLDRLNKASR